MFQRFIGWGTPPDQDAINRMNEQVARLKDVGTMEPADHNEAVSANPVDVDSDPSKLSWKNQFHGKGRWQWWYTAWSWVRHLSVWAGQKKIANEWKPSATTVEPSGSTIWWGVWRMRIGNWIISWMKGWGWKKAAGWAKQTGEARELTSAAAPSRWTGPWPGWCSAFATWAGDWGRWVRWITRLWMTPPNSVAPRRHWSPGRYWGTAAAATLVVGVAWFWSRI